MSLPRPGDHASCSLQAGTWIEIHTCRDTLSCPLTLMLIKVPARCHPKGTRGPTWDCSPRAGIANTRHLLHKGQRTDSCHAGNILFAYYHFQGVTSARENSTAASVDPEH